MQIESMPDDIRGWPLDTALRQRMIIAPQMFSEPSRLGKVVALGDGKLKDGRQHRFEVAVGDIVLCTRYPKTGHTVPWQGTGLFVMREVEILAKLTETANG